MGPPTDPATVLSALRASDPDVLDADELGVFLDRVAQLTSWCESLRVRAVRAQRRLAAAGRADAPRNTLTRSGQSSRDARAAEEREEICTALPAFEDALSTGTIAAGHVDAIAAATRALDDGARADFLAAADELLGDASRQSVDIFARNCRELARALDARRPGDDAAELDRQRAAANVRRWVDEQTGMCHTHLELDPVRDRALWAAIDAQRAALRRQDGNRRTPWSLLQVDAVIAAIGGGDGVDRAPEITVLIDLDSLLAGARRHGVCKTDTGVPLPVSTVRRLCCDAEILPALLGGRGEVLDVGMSHRTATRAQRRALRAMHRTCAHPDCTVTLEACRIHHVVPWRRSGPTDIANLLPLCEGHHHLVHEGGWTVSMTPDRVATWIRPDGVHHHTGPTIDRAPTGVAVDRPPAMAGTG